MQFLGEINRYAKAVYEIADKNKELSILEKDFITLKEVLEKNTELKNFIKNPTYKSNVVEGVIEALSKKLSFSNLFISFLKVVNKNRRFFFIEKIINNFFNLSSQKRGEIQAALRLSHEITDLEKKQISEKLNSTLNKKINISFLVDSSLFVGSVLQIGSTMIDTSAKTKLNKLLNN